ncbi:MAG: DUF1573 domain-containing protein [Spirochaetes bacterium]|nr:DUF1573 domain-containing protein [Spirochaetota bacterium]HPA73014.1 DUF1573 domain-containing protein [Spirochaetota bacterium]
MKQSIFITLTALVILFQSACFGEPRISFTETEHNFGEVDPGLDLKHVFTFRNAGTGTLVIKKIEAG